MLDSQRQQSQMSVAMTQSEDRAGGRGQFKEAGCEQEERGGHGWRKVRKDGLLLRRKGFQHACAVRWDQAWGGEGGNTDAEGDNQENAIPPPSTEEEMESRMSVEDEP